MLHWLRRHPIPIEAHFRTSLVLRPEFDLPVLDCVSAGVISSSR